MQLQHSNALMRSYVDGCITNFTYLLNTYFMHSESADAAREPRSRRNWGKQTSIVNDVIHYECMTDIFVYSLYRTLQVRKISGIFPEKFRKLSDILFFRKSYNPTDASCNEHCCVGVRSYGRQTNWAKVNWATHQLSDNQLGDTRRSTGRQWFTVNIKSK